MGWVGAVAGLLGLLVALWSLKQSADGNAEARKANTHAGAANDESKRANSTANKALEVSRAAEVRNDQLAAIATEFRDVRWRSSLAEPDVVSFMNTGTTPAMGVRLVVRVATFDVQHRPVMDQVPPDSAVGMSLSHLVRHHREMHERALAELPLGTYKEPWVLPVECQLIWSSPAGHFETYRETLTFDKYY